MMRDATAWVSDRTLIEDRLRPDVADDRKPIQDWLTIGKATHRLGISDEAVPSMKATTAGCGC
jgi:hypothetical protein